MTETQQREALELLKLFIGHAEDFGQMNAAEGETLRRARILVKEIESQ
jgi:hypothetical protein